MAKKGANSLLLFGIFLVKLDFPSLSALSGEHFLPAITPRCLTVSRQVLTY